MSFIIENGILKKYTAEQGETDVVIPEGVTRIYSIEHTQNGGNVQIQAYIMHYKNERFPDADLLENI